MQHHLSWGHPRMPPHLPESQCCSMAQGEEEGRVSQHGGWGLAWRLARLSVVGPCPRRRTLPSIYLCLTLATQLLGMWHSLPDASDATSHHSPSLQGRGTSHPEGLRLLGAGRGPPGWVSPSRPCGLRTGRECPLRAGTYSERTRSCSPILRRAAAPMPEGKSQRATARKLLGAVGKVRGLRAPSWGGRPGKLAVARHLPVCVGGGGCMVSATTGGMLSGFSRLGRLPIPRLQHPALAVATADWKERLRPDTSSTMGPGAAPCRAMSPVAWPCRGAGSWVVGQGVAGG